MPLRLTYRAGAITGFIDGRIVNCLVHPAQPGNMPAPGEYLIGAPANDLTYGLVAIMVRTGGGVDPGLAQECVRRLPAGGAINTLFNPTGGRLAAGLAEMNKQEMPGVAVAMMKSTNLSAPGAVFVLAGRPMGGRNCLVAPASSGLFEAIAAGGGAQITVY